MKPLPDFELTLAQQFELAKIERESEQLKKEHLQELLLQASKVMMMKDNIIKGLLRP